MPFPVHHLDKLIKNGTFHVSLMDYMDKDNWFLKEQIEQGKALSFEEFTELVFGLEQLDFNGTMIDSVEGLGEKTNRGEIYRIPISYKRQTFTFSFCFYRFPPKFLHGGTVHYTVYRELLPVPDAFPITDDGKLRKPEYADV